MEMNSLSSEGAGGIPSALFHCTYQLLSLLNHPILADIARKVPCSMENVKLGPEPRTS